MAIIKNPVTVIQSGGGPTPVEPLDPYEVYANTRPVGWLEMPANEDMETESVYILLTLPDEHNSNYNCAVHFGMNVYNYTVDIDFGMVIDGVFTVDSTYSAMGTNANIWANLSIPASMFISVGNGQKQLIMRVRPTSTYGKFASLDWGSYNEVHTLMLAAIEVKIKSDNFYRFRAVSSDYAYNAPALKYITILGNHPALSSGNDKIFANCRHLIAVMAERNGTLKLSSGKNAFLGDYALVAIPKIEVGTNLSYMFSDCREIAAVPEISVTGSPTDYSYMFTGCTKLSAVPLFGTSSGTTFSNMFASCTNLEFVPQFNTSSGTNFQAMFQSCNNLKNIPLLDLSHATNCRTMFMSCNHLSEIPAFDLSAATDLSQMFQYCTELKAVPSMDCSSATNLSQMFQSCTELETVGSLDTSSGTNFSSMFADCKSLCNIAALGTSHGTNLQSLFNGCVLLTHIPALDTSAATNVSSMFSGCVSLENTDNFSLMDFTSVTNASNSASLLAAATISPWGSDYIYLPPSNKAPTSGWGSQAFALYSTSIRASRPVCIIIEDDSAMVPLGATGQQVFGNSNYSYYSNLFVFVPDSMYATYTADSNWANLGNRLKKMSELPS